MDVLEIDRAHVHGTSMGGMVAQVFAGKYPERTDIVVINCAAAKLGVMGRLIFKNWIDIAHIDPDGPGQPHPRRADHLAGRCPRRFLEEQDAGRRSSTTSSDPARLEPRRGVHGRLPGDVRHGPDRRGCRRSRRRRSCSAATRTS